MSAENRLQPGDLCVVVDTMEMNQYERKFVGRTVVLVGILHQFDHLPTAPIWKLSGWADLKDASHTALKKIPSDEMPVGELWRIERPAGVVAGE